MTVSVIFVIILVPTKQVRTTGVSQTGIISCEFWDGAENCSKNLLKLKDKDQTKNYFKV